MDDAEGCCFINYDENCMFLQEVLEYMVRAAKAAFESNQRHHKWILDRLIERAGEEMNYANARRVMQLEDLHAEVLRFMKKLPCFG